jgi:hypothetical protein
LSTDSGFINLIKTLHELENQAHALWRVPPESIWEITHTPKRGSFLIAFVNPFQERTLFFTVEFATLLVLNHLIGALYGKLFRFAPQKLG